MMKEGEKSPFSIFYVKKCFLFQKKTVTLPRIIVYLCEIYNYFVMLGTIISNPTVQRKE